MDKLQQSAIDTFLQLIPYLKEKRKSRDYINSNSAKTLYTIWRTGIVNPDKTYRRPPTISLNDIQKIQKEGLLKLIGNDIKLTTRGEKVIRIMILGDDRSSFDNNDIIVDYNEALSKIKPVKTARRGRKVANNWWTRFEKKSQVSSGNKDKV